MNPCQQLERELFSYLNWLSYKSLLGQSICTVCRWHLEGSENTKFRLLNETRPNCMARVLGRRSFIHLSVTATHLETYHCLTVGSVSYSFHFNLLVLYMRIQLPFKQSYKEVKCNECWDSPDPDVNCQCKY